jgi:very-short-patch-repair endonuclease
LENWSLAVSFPSHLAGEGGAQRRERGMSLATAKKLRKNPTEAEKRLWYHLRARRFQRLKIRRQTPIGPYVVDFVSFQHRPVIEVDGGQHGGEADIKRDDWLKSEGFRVLRFWNNDVLKHTELVLAEISKAIEE